MSRQRADAGAAQDDQAAPIRVRLDEMLSKRGMTLTELSARVDVTVVNLSILKNGRARAIRFSTLARLCEALDCQPGDLLGYDAPVPRSWLQALTRLEPGPPSSGHPGQGLLRLGLHGGRAGRGVAEEKVLEAEEGGALEQVDPAEPDRLPGRAGRAGATAARSPRPETSLAFTDRLIPAGSLFVSRRWARARSFDQSAWAALALGSCPTSTVNTFVVWDP